MPYIIEKTFNSEIFTKVGNPTITDDGIASGFSGSNYLTTSQTISGIWKCTALVNCTNGEENSFGNGIFSGSNSSTEVFYVGIRNRRLQVHLGNIYNDRPTTPIFENNVNYLFELGFTGAKYYLKINNNEVLSVDSTTPLINVGNIQIGTRAINRSAYFRGSIDLKQFKITVDGKVVLNGTTSKEVYVLPSIQEIKDYYSNTLIVQYNGKPKAKATIEMLVDLIYDNVILNQIQEAFDWKTAVGKQLDIIGQWVGVSRIYQQNNISGKTYLSYPGWDDETDTLQHGYSDYTTFNSNTGNDLTYKELETLEANLNDDDYRTVIGLKIIKNNISHTAKNIDDAIWEYFNGKVYTTWSDYKITYHYPAELTTIIEVCNAKNVLLAPIGVNIKLLQTE